MTKEEFVLSEKRKELLDYFLEQFGYDSRIPYDILRTIESQDKEFIKLLNIILKCSSYLHKKVGERCGNEDCITCGYMREIDKISGDLR